MRMQHASPVCMACQMCTATPVYNMYIECVCDRVYVHDVSQRASYSAPFVDVQTNRFDFHMLVDGYHVRSAENQVNGRHMFPFVLLTVHMTYVAYASHMCFTDQEGSAAYAWQ